MNDVALFRSQVCPQPAQTPSGQVDTVYVGEVLTGGCPVSQVGVLWVEGDIKHHLDLACRGDLVTAIRYVEYKTLRKGHYVVSVVHSVVRR